MRRLILTIMFVFLSMSLIVLSGCAQSGSHDEIALDEQITKQKEADGKTGSDNETEEKDSSEIVSVYICGCVASPGVYTLSASCRITDAIQAAGGITDQADAQVLNLALLLTDGMRIYVPSIDETQGMDRAAGTDAAGSSPGGESFQSGTAASGRVNINTASKDELMTLPGIGENKAESILDYRKTQGAFSSIEDIMNISGIKQGVFEKIKDRITV